MTDALTQIQRLQLKARALLDAFGAKSALAGFILFQAEKIGLKERKILRQKLLEQISQQAYTKTDSNFEFKKTDRRLEGAKASTRAWIQLKRGEPILSQSFGPAQEKSLAGCSSGTREQEIFEEFVRQQLGCPSTTREQDGDNHLKSQTVKPVGDFSSFLVPGTRLAHPLASVSLSHTGALGAFVLTTDKSRSIGFDIEQTKRVTNRILSRVAGENEIRQAPGPALLWSAKEAGLKSLAKKGQKLFLKDCVVLGWKKLKTIEQAFVFECLSKKTRQKAKGAAQQIGKWTMAYAESLNP